MSDDRRDWFRVVSSPPDAEPPSPGALAWLWCRSCGTWFLPIDDDDELSDLLELVDEHQADCDRPADEGPESADGPRSGD